MKIDNSKIYYLVHPCTSGGLTIKENRNEEFRISCAIKSIDDNIPLLRPLTLIPHNMSHSDAMDRCYKLLSACDAILLSPRWQTSIGCVLEYEYAIANGLDVIEVEQIDGYQKV